MSTHFVVLGNSMSTHFVGLGNSMSTHFVGLGNSTSTRFVGLGNSMSTHLVGLGNSMSTHFVGLGNSMSTHFYHWESTEAFFAIFYQSSWANLVPSTSSHSVLPQQMSRLQCVLSRIQINDKDTVSANMTFCIYTTVHWYILMDPSDKDWII
jgi:hypothetical protein